MSSKNENYMALISFTDVGIEPQVTMKIPFLDNKELLLIGNYYSIVVGQTDTQGLYGPFPVAYHPEWLVFTYIFTIKDSTIRDKRVLDNGGITKAFFLLFFPTKVDNTYALARRKIESSINEFVKQFKDISEISMNVIEEINCQILQRILTLVAQEEFNEKDTAIKVLERNVSFASAIGKSLKKSFTIIIYDSGKLIAQIMRRTFAIVDLEIFDKIYYRSDKKELIFEGHNLSIIVKLLNNEPLTLFKQNFDAVLYYDDPNLPCFKENAKKLVQATPNNAIISLALENPQKKKLDLKSLGLVEILALRSIFIIDMGTKIAVDAIIDLFERLVERVSS